MKFCTKYITNLHCDVGPVDLLILMLVKLQSFNRPCWMIATISVQETFF